jgi:hypothetical protein
MQVSPVLNLVGTPAWTGLFEAFDPFACRALYRFLPIALFIKREDNWI